MAVGALLARTLSSGIILPSPWRSGRLRARGNYAPRRVHEHPLAREKKINPIDSRMNEKDREEVPHALGDSSLSIGVAPESRSAR